MISLFFATVASAVNIYPHSSNETSIDPDVLTAIPKGTLIKEVPNSVFNNQNKVPQDRKYELEIVDDKNLTLLSFTSQFPNEVHLLKNINVGLSLDPNEYREMAKVFNEQGEELILDKRVFSGNAIGNVPAKRIRFQTYELINKTNKFELTGSIRYWIKRKNDNASFKMFQILPLGSKLVVKGTVYGQTSEAVKLTETLFTLKPTFWFKTKYFLKRFYLVVIGAVLALIVILVCCFYSFRRKTTDSQVI